MPDRGLAFEDRAEQVLDNHVAQTVKLAAEVEAGTRRSARISSSGRRTRPTSTRSVDRGGLRQDRRGGQGGRRAGAGRRDPAGPGRGPSAQRGILWSPTTGPGAQYIKRHPVPFARVHPAPRARRMGELGREDGHAGHGRRARQRACCSGGPVPIGDVICFEVAYDGAGAFVGPAGAQLLVVQTNNATFGHTAETYQQLAMSQLRAVETGRTVLQAATTGKSAVIGPDGGRRATVRTRCSGRAILVAQVPLRDRVLRWPSGSAPCPEYFLAAAGRARRRCRAGRCRRRRRRGRRPKPTVADPDEEMVASEHDATPTRRVLVIIPTYNERENIERIVERVHDSRAARPTSSSSTTAARTAPARSPTRWPTTISGCTSCTAPAKAGLGAAYIAGFDWGLAARLRRAGRDGRRRVARARNSCPGCSARWSTRIWCSGRGGSRVERSSTGRGAARCSRAAATSTPGWRSGSGCATRPAATAPTGARCWRASTTPAVASQGYCFQIDLAWRALDGGYRVVEVPITFVERERGESKMSGDDRARGVLAGHQWGAAYRGGQVRAASGAGVGATDPLCARRAPLATGGRVRNDGSGSRVRASLGVRRTWFRAGRGVRRAAQPVPLRGRRSCAAPSACPSACAAP